MSDFDVNSDLMEETIVDEEKKEMDETEKEDKKRRRHAEIDEKEIEELEKTRNEAGTIKQTMWSARCLRTWCTEKDVVIDLETITKSELNQLLRQFYATVKNGKGEGYGFSSYVSLRAGLNRYINDPPISRHWCLLKDPEFITSNKVFVGVLKKLRREGLDQTSHHPVLTKADFQTIRHSRALDPNTPRGLVNKVWFDVQLHMGRKAKEKYRQLKPDSFIICLNENGTKYATFGESYEDERNDERARAVMHEQPGDRLCPVASLEKYLSLLPPNATAFYLHPKRTRYLEGPWYSREPMGVNFLGSMLPQICKAAGTKTIYTNHCLRRTSVHERYHGPKTREAVSGTGKAFQSSPQETSNDSSQISRDPQAEGSSHDPQSADQTSTQQHEGSGVSRLLVLSSLKTSEKVPSHRSTSRTYFALPATISCPSDEQTRAEKTYSTINNSTEVSVMDEQQNKLQEKKVEMSTEDTAQCSEDLVIAKVEDVRDEMLMDVDKNLTGNKEDKPEGAENKSAVEIKNETTDMPAGTSAQPELTSEKLVNIKDEPMDEEYEKASTLQRPMGTIKDEPDTSADFNQTQDEFKIGAVYSVGGKTVEAPAASPAITASLPVVTLGSMAPAMPVGVVCTGCKKVLLKGQTAFQRKGSSNLYCSPQCLCSSSTLVVKMPPKKICSSCYKEIDPKDLHTAADASGVTKDFCSKRCLNSSSFRCSRCQKKSVGYTHQVNLTNSTHKLCSEMCFTQFRAANNVSLNSCMNCNAYCHNTDGSRPALQLEDSTVRFCNQICLTTFLKKSKHPVACKMCRNLRPAADMVKSSNLEGVGELFCSAGCATANKVQNVSSSGAAVECNSCKKKLAPQYHLAMSDGTIQNFCSFSCVVTFQESLSKKRSQNQVNTVTSSSNSVPVPAAAKSAESSSSAKTNAPVQTVTKIPCAQCLLAFYHKPDLLEFKKKMHAFCGNDCIEEFKRINNVMARCEYCKIDKIVREVKRINKIDRCFCSEGCKLLYNHDLVKRWGKKHCRNCVHCSGSAQTLVTSVIANKKEEFCGNVCLTQYKSLFNQEIKCSMCKQAKKMNETVKWMGEIKHFCSLQCLMFFCSLQGTTGTATKAANKTVPAQGTSPVSILPQPTGSRTAVGTKEAPPVIANVISLSSAPNGHPGVLGNTILQGAVPASTVKVTGHLSASTQTDAVKAALPPKILKNKALLCKPLSQNKGTSCKPNTCDANTQTDAPSFMVLPVPVPVYVPVPMNLYTQYTPRPVGLPLPVPVPLFFPTTLDSAERIVETIQEIKEKIPDDPLEADLIMMAEMVAEDAEKEKHNTTSDQTENLMDDLDLEALSNSLSWEEESVSSAQTSDQALEHERTSSKTVMLTLIPSPTDELQMDLEADFPIESIERLRGQKPQEEQASNSVKRKPRRKGRDGLPQKKRGRKCAPAIVTTLAQTTLANNLSKLQHEYGIRAWRDWVLWRNSQPHLETPKFGSRSMTFKEDLLKCSTAELSFGLSRFISEVRRPNGDKYSPDSIFYLCLCIQKHLFENERMENIFADFCYSRFCQEMTNMLNGWTPTVLPSGYVHSRIEEEYLWDCKQLGAFSPSVLLNTLLYFFTKFFNYKTVEQHRRLSFGHVIRCSRNKSTSKEGCLRFYPPKDESNTDGVPAKRRKEEDDDKDVVLEIKENSTNPLRCPVRLYEFYFSKCSPTVRNDTTQFYLNPERSCVPCSPMWFTTSSLSDEALKNMLARILTVRELHLQEEKSTHESDSDSDD